MGLARGLFMGAMVLQACTLMSVLAQTIVPPSAVPPSVGTFPFADIQVHYQMHNQNKGAALVLFLHGAKFDSDTWKKIGTLALLNEQGYRAIAIDLPGFGKTPKLPFVDDNARAELVHEAFKFAQQQETQPTPMVLVSPSMSGKWAMSYIDRHGTELSGWVALAPAGVPMWPGPSAQVHRQVKLLAMYGENDRMKEDASKLTKLFANSLSVSRIAKECLVSESQGKAHSNVIIGLF
ncbi:Alpha/Beta hydrolase protein [Dunaliella salina]|uniref:Alpha/Beta hydrolase protein n=1 Tax=Dunaliella salina TaxID=3046 RepID=A0ABQ7GGN6_DUNSA|nr:Alpha/Beta hydrolase protein [Dunaliella salina]|eukprot:KAF5833761.1 Alpha/Beta hydrolase protein [Dunaliella salina]